MSHLTIHPASVKSLAYLDSLTEDKDKLMDITEQTTGAPLRRLLLSAISRHTVAGQPEHRGNDYTQLLELLIAENLNGNSENTETGVDVAGERAQQALLAISIIRHAYYD